MVECSELFVGMDVSKDRHAVAVAEGGRDGEVRFYGEIGSDNASVRRLVRKLERPGIRLPFCYEAGPTGYGLERLIEELGHECAVIAPSLIPRPAGRSGQDEPPRCGEAGAPVPCRRTDGDLDTRRNP